MILLFYQVFIVEHLVLSNFNRILRLLGSQLLLLELITKGSRNLVVGVDLFSSEDNLAVSLYDITCRIYEVSHFVDSVASPVYLVPSFSLLDLGAVISQLKVS